MTATTQRRYNSRLILAIALLGIVLSLTFRTEAQSSQSKNESKKQSGATTYGQSHAGSGTQQIEGVTRAQLEKAQQQLEKAQQQLMKQDWAKVEAEMQKAITELEKALRSTDFEFAKAEMEKAMVEMEKSLAAQQGKLAVEMKKAEAEMKKAQEEMELMQQGMELMEKDGLLKPDESMNIDWDDDILIINGQRQTEAVSDKYRKYFKKHRTNRQKVVI
jgi:hypothetical protein